MLQILVDRPGLTACAGACAAALLAFGCAPLQAATDNGATAHGAASATAATSGAPAVTSEAVDPASVAPGVAGDDPGADGAALAPEVLHVDAAGTRVRFSMRLLVVRRITGQFPQVEGEVRLHRDAQQADIAVRIDAREVTMDRAAWSEWARSPEFFDAADHPWISFEATDVPLQAFRTGGVLEGLLTLRGVTLPVALQLLPSPCDEPGRACPVRARGELDRSEFGMSARRFALGDKVRLDFEIRVSDAAPGAQP